MAEPRIPHPDLPPPASYYWRHRLDPPQSVLLATQHHADPNRDLSDFNEHSRPCCSWAMLDAHWSGDSREACPANGGACWVFIRVHFEQFMYGFYPENQRWRVKLALVSAHSRRRAAVYPQGSQSQNAAGAQPAGDLSVIAFILFKGGLFGLSAVDTS
jgi:general L-amino acid transport system permease protein